MADVEALGSPPMRSVAQQPAATGVTPGAALLLATAVVLLAALSPLLGVPVYGGLFGHDADFALASLHFMDRAWAAGIAWPRWVMDSNFGLGAPTFTTYPPLTYWVGAALRRLTGLPIETTLALSVTLWRVAGLVTAFLWLRRHVPAPVALAAAACGAALPYVALVNPWVRFAQAEVAGAALLPLVLLATERAALGRSASGIAGLALLCRRLAGAARFLPLGRGAFALLVAAVAVMTVVTLPLWIALPQLRAVEYPWCLTSLLTLPVMAFAALAMAGATPDRRVVALRLVAAATLGGVLLTVGALALQVRRDGPAWPRFEPPEARLATALASRRGYSTEHLPAAAHAAGWIVLWRSTGAAPAPDPHARPGPPPGDAAPDPGLPGPGGRGDLRPAAILVPVLARPGGHRRRAAGAGEPGGLRRGRGDAARTAGAGDDRADSVGMRRVARSACGAAGGARAWRWRGGCWRRRCRPRAGWRRRRACDHAVRCAAVRSGAVRSGAPTGRSDHPPAPSRKAPRRTRPARPPHGRPGPFRPAPSDATAAAPASRRRSRRPAARLPRRRPGRAPPRPAAPTARASSPPPRAPDAG